MTMTDEVCSHIVSCDSSRIDAATIARVKTRLLDAVGVIAAGVEAPRCNDLLALLKSYGNTEQSSVLYKNAMLCAPHAAMVNSFMMRSYDFEAIEAEGENQTSSAAHISGTTVPTALAVAERAHASGLDLITALALGDDLAARLGAASGFDVYGGWDNTGTINGLGATAIAGKLIGLDEAQMNNAFGLVLNMLAGSMDNINFKTLAFKLPMALSSRNAIFAADFAKYGMTATHDAFGGKKGYFTLYCGDAKKPDLLCKNLGNIFYGDCVIKPWSACRATHPSIDACVQIASSHDIDPSNIEKIIIHATPRTAAGFVGQPFEPGEEPGVQGAFSIIYTAAIVMGFKTVRPEHFKRDVMESAMVKELISKVEIVPSLAPDEYQTAEAEVILCDGTVLRARCDHPKGDIYKNPMSQEEVLDKFYANIDFSETLSRKQADRIVEAIAHFEDIDDVSVFVKDLS